MTSERIASSFRDPSGFVYVRDGVLLRQVNQSYRADLDFLMESGLYDELLSEGLLIHHEELDRSARMTAAAYRVMRPEIVPFISYPYEWCFSQFKEAALATLRIQRLALSRGMALKDASAYNIQFVRGRPVLIDLLSFERLREAAPWVAYRQFCQHFLAPLALMALQDVRLGQLMRVYIDGIPLSLASSLLRRSARLKPGLLIHLVWHAKSQQDVGRRRGEPKRPMPFGSKALMGLVESLQSAVEGLRWESPKSDWSDYYETSGSYSDDSMAHKREMVQGHLEELSPAVVWDLGASTGEFSRIAAGLGAQTIAVDGDAAAVELNYRRTVSEDNLSNVLPLVMDLSNPSPGIGWDNRERESLTDRGPADVVLALALIHHLAIVNNVPLPAVAAYFRKLCTSLIIEFIPKSDPKVELLLQRREDIFTGYNQEGFEKAFSGHFRILEQNQIKGSERTLYKMA